MLDSNPAQIILEVFACIFLKKAAEIIRIHVYFPCQYFQGQILVIMLVNIDLRLQEIPAAVVDDHILHFPKIFYDNPIEGIFQFTIISAASSPLQQLLRVIIRAWQRQAFEFFSSTRTAEQK